VDSTAPRRRARRGSGTALAATESAMMTISTSTADDGAASVALAGTLDETTIWELRFELSCLLAGLPPNATIDVSALQTIDGAGAGLLVAFCERLRYRGARAHIVGLHGQPLRVFRHLNLDDNVTTAAPVLP
jgi:anti-anti-sigma factor